MVDLDRPFDTPRTCNVVHQGMWEVGVVQWNPHHSRASYIASTVTADRNTSLLILLISGQYQHSDLEYRRKISASILIQGARAYRSRFVAVTHLSRLLTFGYTQDLCWSPEDENLLATCSADGNIHIWDTRIPRQAVRMTVLSVSKGWSLVSTS